MHSDTEAIPLTAAVAEYGLRINNQYLRARLVAAKGNNGPAALLLPQQHLRSWQGFLWATKTWFMLVFGIISDVKGRMTLFSKQGQYGDGGIQSARYHIVKLDIGLGLAPRDS